MRPWRSPVVLLGWLFWLLDIGLGVVDDIGLGVRVLVVVAEARTWRDVLPVTGGSIERQGGLRRRHHFRPGELNFEIEEDPLYFPPLTDEEAEPERKPSEEDTKTKTKTKTKTNTLDETKPTSAQTTVELVPFPTETQAPSGPTPPLSTATIPPPPTTTTVSPIEQPFPSDIHVHKKSPKSDPKQRDISSHRSHHRSRSRNFDTLVTTETTNSVLVATESPIAVPTDSPISTPTEQKVEVEVDVDVDFEVEFEFDVDTAIDIDIDIDLQKSYTYPEDSITPLQPPRWYFNYDTSSDSLYGPGYSVLSFSSENPNELIVEYGNNAWVHYESPPPMDPDAAMALANGLSDPNTHRDGTATEVEEDSPFFYWDEFGPDGIGFGPWKGALASRNLRSTPNHCGNVGRQSPIDVRPTGVACLEHHQIRSRRGDFRLGGDRGNVRLSILPSKLRVWVQRRPCTDLHNPVCSEPDPPHADFPHGWPGFADMIHVDFKFPGEHTIYGEVFDGEMQIYHLHPGRRRLPVVSVLMKVDINTNTNTHTHTTDANHGHNEYLQQLIDAFQYEYDTNKARCAAAAIREGNRRRRLRVQKLKSHETTRTNNIANNDNNNNNNNNNNTHTGDAGQRRASQQRGNNNTLSGRGRGRGVSYQSTQPKNNTGDAEGTQKQDDGGDFPFSNLEKLANAAFGGNQETLEHYASLLRNDSNFTVQKDEHGRRLASRWYPHHKSLVPTYYFYGYDGSLTEPPCTEIVSWFVMDAPMKISKNQLEQMKKILFTNVHGDTCKETSVHYRKSVARPIQETGGNRDVWHCTRDNYVPDHERPPAS